MITTIFSKNELRPFLKFVFWRRYVGIFLNFLSRLKPLKKMVKNAVLLTPGGMEIQNMTSPYFVKWDFIFSRHFNQGLMNVISTLSIAKIDPDTY